MGKLTFPDGGCYEGEFRDDEINGMGTRLYSNGNSLTGGSAQWICIDLS
jgi:hypothetical protein